MADEVYCELYLMKSKDPNEYTLLYGYGQRESLACRPWHLDDKAAPLPVSVARATLSQSEATEIVTQLQGAASFPLQIASPKAHTLIVRGAERVRRPPVFRRPSTDSSAFDAAFGNRLCEVVEFWNLDKGALLAELATAASYRVQVERLHEVIELIATNVGRDFKTRAYATLGNFELFTVRPHLYRWTEISVPGRGTPVGLTIEVDAEHPAVGEWLSIVVSLENAGITIHSSIREWRRGESAILEFRAAEPFSCAEVMIYGETGNLVDQARHAIMTKVELTGELVTGRKKVKDAWSQEVARKAGKHSTAKFGHAHRIDVVGHVISTVVGDDDASEPWQPIFGSKPAIFGVCVDSRDTYFLPKRTAEEEVTRFETIRSLFDASDVTRAICVDPWFDRKALPLLARVRNQCRVEVVTRADPAELHELMKLLRQKPDLVTHPLKILRPVRGFHDRFLVVERGSIRDVLVLSNSYSPVGPTDPIVVVRASGLGALQILEYIDDLCSGAITYWPEVPAQRPSSPDTDEAIGGVLVTGILSASTADPRTLISSIGPECWSQLGHYLATDPWTTVVQLVLDFLGAHSSPSSEIGALGEPDRLGAVATLRRTIERAFGGFEIPDRLHHPGETSIETWIEILRRVARASGNESPVESAISTAASHIGKYEVHYGVNLGLRLLAAWAPRTFVEIVEAPLENAIQSLAGLPDDADPMLSRPVATGALVLRELLACMPEPEVIEALLGAESRLMKRMAVVALFTHPWIDRKQVERGLAAHLDPEDIIWALLMLRSARLEISKEDRQDLLTKLIMQIDESRVRLVLRTAGFAVAKQIGDKLAVESPNRADRAYAVVHETFEERLLDGKLAHYHVGSTELEHLELARYAVRYRAAHGAIDLADHIHGTVQKAGRRARGFFRPRERILDYPLWIGGVRLMQLSALYFVSVCKDLKFSEQQRTRLEKLAADLLPFLKASPSLDPSGHDDACSVRPRAIDLDHALREVLALREKLTSPSGQGRTPSSRSGA